MPGILRDMLLAVVACLLSLAAVLVAVYADPGVRPLTPVGLDHAEGPGEEDRVTFPLVLRGYDPAAVDVAMARLRAAYRDLLAEASPQVVERARTRAEAGREPSSRGAMAGPGRTLDRVSLTKTSASRSTRSAAPASRATRSEDRG